MAIINQSLKNFGIKEISLKGLNEEEMRTKTINSKEFLEMKDLIKLVKDLLEVIPKEEEVTIEDLKDRLDSMEFILLTEQIPLYEENIYKIISSCLPNDVEYVDIKEWQKKIIQIWNSK